MFWNLGISLPVYVTRPNIEGAAAYSMSAWMSISVLLILWLNLLLWGGYGVYAFVNLVF